MAISKPISKQARKRLEDRRASLKSSIEKSKASQANRAEALACIDKLLALVEHGPACGQKIHPKKRFARYSPDSCLHCLLLYMKDEFKTTTYVDYIRSEKEVIPPWLKTNR